LRYFTNDNYTACPPLKQEEYARIYLAAKYDVIRQPVPSAGDCKIAVKTKCGFFRPSALLTALPSRAVSAAEASRSAR
jgi:hypothetical protein